MAGSKTRNFRRQYTRAPTQSGVLRGSRISVPLASYQPPGRSFLRVFGFSVFCVSALLTIAPALNAAIPSAFIFVRTRVIAARDGAALGLGLLFFLLVGGTGIAVDSRAAP